MRASHLPADAAWLFWVAQAAAILIKGPIIPLLGILTIGTLVDLRPRPKLAARIETAARHCARRLLVSPWVVAISLRSAGPSGRKSVGKDMLGKVASGQESHGFPPGYYVLTFFVVRCGRSARSPPKAGWRR